MQIDMLDKNDVIASDTVDTPLHSRLSMPLTFRVKELQSRIRDLILREIKFDINHPIQSQVLRPELTEWKTGRVQVNLTISFVEEGLGNSNQSEEDDSDCLSDLDKLRSLETEIENR